MCASSTRCGVAGRPPGPTSPPPRGSRGPPCPRSWPSCWRPACSSSARRATARRARAGPPSCSRSTPPPARRSASTSGTRTCASPLADLNADVLAERHLGARRRPRRRRGARARPPSSSTRCWPRPTSAATRCSGCGHGPARPDRRRHRAPSARRPSSRDGAGVHAGDELASRLGVQVAVDNDANLGALAEHACGAGARRRRHRLRQGRLRHRRRDRPRRPALPRASAARRARSATSIVDDDGRVCRCGNRGCLETVAGRPARCSSSCAATHGDGPHARRDARARRARATSACRRVVADAGPRHRPRRGRRSSTCSTPSASSSAATSPPAGEPLLERRPRVDRPLRAAGRRGGGPGHRRRAGRPRRGARRAGPRHRRHREPSLRGTGSAVHHHNPHHRSTRPGGGTP